LSSTKAVSVDELIEYIKMRFQKFFPGYLPVLNHLFEVKYGLDPLIMFLKDSSTFYETLKEYYDSSETALFIVIFIIKSILIKLNRLDLIEEAIKKAVNNSIEFKRLLKNLGIDLMER